jgi:hypothetical protein
MTDTPLSQPSPTDPDPPPYPVDEVTTVTIGTCTLIYTSAYSAAKYYIRDYMYVYAPGATFIKTPARSTITNGLSRSSNGFFTTLLTEDRNGQKQIAVPVIFQITTLTN